MYFRTLEKEDYIYSSNINGLSFFYPIDRKSIEEKLADGDEFYKNWIGAFNDENKLIACFAVVPYEVYFDGHIVPMGGIGGVSTLLEYRRQGAIRGIFNFALRKMYDEGTVFSALYPFSYEYYRKFGYDVGMTRIQVVADTAPLLAYPMAPTVKQFVPEDSIGEASDPDDIVEIYNTWAPRYNMSVDRTGYHWNKLLEKEPTKSSQHTYVNYDEQKKPVSYLVFKKNDKGQLEVVDCAWVNKDGLYYILGLIGRLNGNLGDLTWFLPEDVMPELIYKQGNLYKFEKQARCYKGMNRIINVAKALELMKKPAIRGSVQIKVTDPYLPENTGVWKIVLDGKGSGTVEKVNARKWDMECDIQGLTRLVTGFATPNTVKYEPNVTINSKEEILDMLFVPKNIHLNEYF